MGGGKAKNLISDFGPGVLIGSPELTAAGPFVMDKARAEGRRRAAARAADQHRAAFMQPVLRGFGDEVLRRAREAERRRARGSGTSTTFLSGALGPTSPLVTTQARMNGG